MVAGIVASVWGWMTGSRTGMIALGVVALLLAFFGYTRLAVDRGMAKERSRQLKREVEIRRRMMEANRPQSDNDLINRLDRGEF